MNKNTHHILFEEKIISEQQFNKLEEIESKKIFSVFYELKTMLYLGVLLFTSGVGFLIYQNVGETGHYLALTTLVTICGFCFKYTLSNANAYNNDNTEASTPYFDYILLLGSLIFISIQAYLQFLFNIFTDYWALTTIINSMLFFVLAYRFNHAGILSLAITSFTSFLGINVSPQDWVNQDFLELKELFNIGIALSVFLTVGSEILSQKNIKKHFSFTYFNFASLIFCTSVLSGLFSEHYTWLYSGLVIGGIMFMAWYANKNKSFLFLIYAFLFAYIGLTYLFFSLVSFHDESIIVFWSFYTILSCVSMVYFVKRFKNYYK